MAWSKLILLPWTECADLGVSGGEDWVHSIKITSNGVLVALVKSNTSGAWYLCRSLDDGDTWQDRYYVYTTTGMHGLTCEGGTLFAYGHKYAISTDHGANWSQGTPACGEIKSALNGKADDGLWYVGAGSGVHRSSNLTSWTQVASVGGIWTKVIAHDAPNDKMYFHCLKSGADPIYEADSPYTSWSIHTADFLNPNYQEPRGACYHNGALYMVGVYSDGSWNRPAIWKLVTNVWTLQTLPPNAAGETANSIYSLNDELLFVLGGHDTAPRNTMWVSNNDGVNWYNVGLDFLMENQGVGNVNFLREGIAYNSNTKTLFVANAMNGEGRVWKADMASFEVPWTPTGFSVTPIRGGVLVDANTPFDEGFDTNLDDWSTTKKLGTETATLQTNTYYKDKYLKLDLPDSADTDIRVISDIAIPNNVNWELDVDILEYTPDDSTNGLGFIFEVRDVAIDNSFLIRGWKEGTDYYTQCQYRYDGGSYTWLDSDLAPEPYYHSQIIALKLKRFGNTLSAYAFMCEVDTNSLYTYRWQAVGARGFLPYAGSLVYPVLGAWDNSNRGGSVCFNNLRYRQTNSIYHDTSPGVTTGTGTKESQKRLPFRHVADDKTYYIATSENKLEEGTACSEVNATPLPGFEYGAIDQFNDTQTRCTRVCRLNETQYAVMFFDVTSTYIECTVYTYNPSTLALTEEITSNIETDIEGGASVSLDACTVDEDKWALVYRQGSTNYLRINLLSWNGSAITNHGNQLSTTVTTPSYWSCGILETNKLWVVWSQTGQDDQEGIIGTVSGSSISFGSVQDMDTSYQEDHMGACTVNSTQIFASFYENYNSQDQFKGRRYSVSGTTISSGAERTGRHTATYFNFLYDHQFMNCCSPDGVNVVVARQFRDPYVGDQQIGVLQIASNIGATNFTWGKEYRFSSNDDITNPRMVPLEENYFALAYHNKDTGQGEIQILEMDVTNDTFIPYMIGAFKVGNIAGGGDRGLDLKLIADRILAVAYQNDDDASDVGESRLIKFYLPNDVPPTPQSPVATGDTSDIDVSWDANFENEYFQNLDNFSFVKKDGTETATIVSERMRLDIPDSLDGSITAKYDQHDIPAGDFSISIDFSNYVADATDGFVLNLIGTDSEVTPVDQLRIWYRSRTASPTHFIKGYFLEDSSTTYTTEENPATIPTKLKIERIGNILYVSYFMAGSWYVNGSQDFGARAANITKLWIEAFDNSLHGGSVDVDNLKLQGGTDSYNLYWSDTPGVTVETGTKIAGVSNPYEHVPPSLGELYYYIITSENEFAESDASSEVNAKTAPGAPTGVGVVPDIIKNTVSWSPVTGADSYNIYWAIDYYPEEYFGVDLSGWDTYRLNGDEDVYISAGELYTRLYTGSSTGWDLVRKVDIPSGDFQVDVDMTQYVPSNNSNGHYAYFWIKDSYAGYTDYAFVRYHLTNSGTVFNIRAELSINGTPNQINTTIASVPSKFRIKRVGTNIEIYYYISSWVLVHSADFGGYAANLDLVQLSGRPNSTLGGIIKWDDVLYQPDLKAGGTKITGVTSPYEHTPLTPGEEYFYVVVAENATGEGLASLQDMGIPEAATPDPPTGISITPGEGENTLNFTADGEADETHAYWLNTTPVTPGTGNKISDITSPHDHTSLDPDLTYYYIFTSENVYGEGDPSIEYNGSPYPVAPTGVACVEGIEKNTISWNPVDGADSYNIYWSDTSPVTKGTGTKITGVTSPYDHTPLTPGVPIYYVVTAEDEDGESSISTEVWGSPSIAAPLNPDATASGANEITVTWDSVLGATKYNVYWLKTPGVTKGTGNKLDNVTSPYVHDSLDEGDTYYYVITAENAIEEGDESDEVSAIAQPVPNPPDGVAAVSSDIEEITVSWNPVAGADSYNLYWSLFTGLDKLSGTKITGATSPHVFSTPTPDITYYFFVTAVDSLTGESDESLEVNAFALPPIPDAPTGVGATPGEATISISFTGSLYADSYNIYWKDTPGVTKANGTKITGVTSPHEFTVPALYDNYYFVVTAENESGESVESAEVNDIPTPIAPDPPINVTGTPTDSNELTISWTAATYAVTYNLYYARLPNVTKTNSTKVTGIGDLDEILSDLIAGRYYYFAVSSVNPEGESDLSEEASAKVYVSLSGESIFYIKAESEQNGIIVTWGDLEGAESYNLYWSKTTPVSIATANKIEDVTSPYRHYRTSTDDPYYIVTGVNPLGESDPSAEAFADPEPIDFQSILFLPENLREYPLFQEFCNILDYVVEKYHYENIDKLTGLYDAVHDDFDPDYVLGLLGSDYFLQFDLDADQKKALCLLLSNLYDMKGTHKGLDYVLRLLGLDATVYEWYNINAGLYPEIPETVDPCSIVIDLGLGDHSLLDEEEDDFVNLASYLLWVCVKLHGIFWSKKFEDWFEGIEDELVAIEFGPIYFDKFCSWRYNYPDTVIIGGEIGIDGDTEGVCDPHLIGEPGLIIGGGQISQLTWLIET